MKRSGFIFFVLFMFAVVLLVVTYLVPAPTTEDISPGDAPRSSSKKPATQEITVIDSLEKYGDEKVQIDYYIIVESYRNLSQAQQRADKLINEFGTYIIVIPPTKEGYYRISYGKYSTFGEAKFAIKSIRKNISSGAWIFSVIK